MSEDQHIPLTVRQLHEAEDRIAALRDAVRIAEVQGRFHLLATLDMLIEQAMGETKALREKIAVHIE